MHFLMAVIRVYSWLLLYFDVLTLETLWRIKYILKCLLYTLFLNVLKGIYIILRILFAFFE